MQGTGVGLRVDGDGFDAELFAGADDAAGDLAAVGNEDLCTILCVCAYI